jgi:hypothetical protein
MKRYIRFVVGSALAIGAGMTLVSGSTAAGQVIHNLNARVVAINIPGASAIAQIGTFVIGGTLDPSPIGAPCANPNPIPKNFSGDIQAGAILDPNRILVGSQSNFGAPLDVVGLEGSFLSIDPARPGILNVPSNFARNVSSSVPQPSTPDGAVRMFAANNLHWLNNVNNKEAVTAQYTGVSNPLGLSNNNGFGRIWPANAPFGATGAGSSSILDPTGLPLKGAPNSLIGGVYVGNLTNRNKVTGLPPLPPPQPQVIPGALKRGAVGTALLGPSPDLSCRAVFVVVTADGAIVQEHTAKGLDGLAPPGTVRSILGSDGNAQDEVNEPRFGVIMNPYNLPPKVVRQLFVSEPFYDTIAVINLVVVVSKTDPSQLVFGLSPVNPVTRISSPSLNFPVDLTPVKRDTDTANWASNTTLDDGSNFYVANQGDNTIVRMKQDGTVVAVRVVAVNGQPLDNVVLNGIAASADATDMNPTPSTIYATFIDPNSGQGGVLAMPAF